MEVVKLSAKGQIVIPAWIRKGLGLAAGDQLLVERKQETVILKIIPKLWTRRGIDTLKGVSKDLAKLRKEWDEEFEHGRDKEFGHGKDT
jgi:AbrB family looped-hinge helix DNA binding protein